jgi:hypothetical protein
MLIRDGDSSDPGSGMEKSRIRDPGLTSRIRNTFEPVYIFQHEKKNTYPNQKTLPYI